MTTKTFTFAPTDAITADIRAVELDGVWWFVAADACRALGLKPSKGGFTNHMLKLNAEEKRVETAAYLGVHESDMRVPRGGMNARTAITVIRETGLYKLIMRSDKEVARTFQTWLAEAVLPALRRDGVYVMNEEKVAAPDATLTDLDALRDQIETLLQRKAAILEERLAAAEAQVAKLEPEAGAFTNFLGTDGKLTLRDAAKQLGLGPKDFVSRLIAGGYLFRSSGDLHVKAEYAPAGRGWFETRTRSGFGWDRIQVFVTNKGLAAFAKKLMIKVEA